MSMVKAGRPLVELVKLCYAADRPPLVEGRHGVGKSELLQRAAAELKIEYLCRDLSLMEPTDLVGLPKLDGSVTRFLPPSFLPTHGKGLLVFEELNRCPAYMRAPCLQLLTARSLNDYVLPAGWLPVAAINPAEDGYEADELDAALVSRFVRVAVEPDHQEWLAWARTAGIHPGVLSYVESDPTIFQSAVSNPRAWAYVSSLLRAADGAQASREPLQAAIAGTVGAKRAAAFLKVLREDIRPLTANEVFDYERHRPQVQGWIAGGQLDTVKTTLLNVKKQLQARPHYDCARTDRTTWKNLAAFLADLPGDLREEAEAFFREREYDVPGTRKRSKP